jgi:hypothetical protein
MRGYYYNNYDRYQWEVGAAAVVNVGRTQTQLVGMPVMLKRYWQSRLRGE